MKHFTSPDFWACYQILPESVQSLADKNFILLKNNPYHPSLHFKRIKMKLNKNIAKLSQMKNIVNDEYVDASIKDRIEMVWDITQELWAISTKGNINAKSRLQRNVTNLTKA